MNYGLDINLGAVHFVRSLRRTEGDRLVRWMDQLQDNPFQEGELTVFDATGREIQVSRFDRFAIYHWTDHAVKTVRVVRIETNA